MTLREALLSEKPFKRPLWRFWAAGINRRNGKPTQFAFFEGTGKQIAFSIEDLTADDYILKPEIVK